MSVVVIHPHRVVFEGLRNLLKGTNCYGTPTSSARFPIHASPEVLAAPIAQDVELYDNLDAAIARLKDPATPHVDLVVFGTGWGSIGTRDFQTGNQLMEDLRSVNAPIIVLNDGDPSLERFALGINADDLTDLSRPWREIAPYFASSIAKKGRLSSSTLTKLFDVLAKKEKIGPLSNRESQVLRHVATGCPNKQVAYHLGISIETVKEHVQNILRKLDVSDRTQAATWAVRGGHI